MNPFRDLEHALLRGPDPAPAWTRGPGRIRRLTPVLLLALALLLGLAAVANAQKGGLGPQLVAVASAASLALAAWRPLLAWRIAWVVGLIALAWPNNGETFAWYPAEIWAYLAVCFILATAQPWRVLIWVWLASMCLMWPVLDRGTRAGATLLVTVLFIFGYQFYRRAQTQQRLVVEQERGVVLTERARIARELHDVVAHHMSLIAVRAETAPYRLGDLPEPVRDEFAALSAAARESLTEMRRLLGVLRSDTAHLTAPQPDLGSLDALVAAAEAVGTRITVRREGALDDLPPGVQLSAYRIVQESLSNAARHAPGGTVTVALLRVDDSVRVRVTSGRGSAPARTGPVTPGHGIQGMRERAAMLGGDLTAGPTADGGFEVAATLPIKGAE